MEIALWVVAVWGAVLSTLLGVVQLHTWWRGKPKASLCLSEIERCDAYGSHKQPFPYLVVSVINNTDHQLALDGLRFVPLNRAQAPFVVRESSQFPHWRVGEPAVPAHDRIDYSIPWPELVNRPGMHLGAKVFAVTSTGDELYAGKATMQMKLLDRPISFGR